MADQTGDQLRQLQELSLNRDILAMTNPWLGSRPDVMMELAGSGLAPEDIAANSAAMFGMRSIDELRATMENLSPVAQRSVYGRLTESQQRALDQMQYRAPDAGGQSLIGQISSVVAKPLELGWQGISTVGGPVVGGAFDLLTWIGDQPAHLYRSIRQLDSWQQWAALGGAALAVGLAIPTMGSSLAFAGTLMSAGMIGGAALGGASIAAAVTARGEWVDALQATWDGERSFDRGAQRDARRMLGGDELVNMAKEIAIEVDPYDLAVDLVGERGGASDARIEEVLSRVAAGMADLGSAEYERIYGGLLTLIQQEPFLKAIDTLQQGKVSFGRDIANVAGLDPNSSTYNLVSGGLDALWLMTMDPTMAIGKLSQAGRVRRYGAGMAGGDAFLERLTHLSNNDPLVRHLHDGIADAITSNNFDAMPPAARGMFLPAREWMLGEGIETMDRQELLRFFHEQDGLRLILEGKGSVRGLDHAVISNRTPTHGWGRFVNELRDFRDAADDVVLERWMRRLAEKHGVVADLEAWMPSNLLDEGVKWTVVDDDIVGSGIGAALGRGFARLPGGTTASSLMASITQMAPANKAIRVVGEGVDSDVPRLISTMGRAFNMPSKMRREWLNTVMSQGSGAERIAVLQSFMDTGFRLAGFESNPELAALSGRYLTKFGQAYGLGGLDRFALDGVTAMTGIYPSLHQATHYVMPDLAELTHAVRRGHILKRVAKVTDSDFVEASMSRYWKPAVLLRIGFIPRAAGEEGLAWLARIGEGGIAQEFGARSLSMRGLYDEAIAKQLDGLPLSIAETQALNWQVPTHVRPLVRMLSRGGWADPVESMFDAYGRGLRGFLEQGVNFKIGDPQWYHGLLYGKSHSWRRLVANGVDPMLREAGDSWVRSHGAAMMRATSSMNASLFEKSVVNPDIDYYLMPDPKNPGHLVEQPLITMRGERYRIQQGQQGFEQALHHRMAEAFDDMIGPTLSRMYMHYFPGFPTLQRSNVAEAVEMNRKVESFAGRKFVAEALQPRTDNWRAAADVLRTKEPDLAAVIDDALLRGEVDWNDIRVGVRRLARKDPPKYSKLEAELDGITPMIEGLGALDVRERAWMTAALSSDDANGGRLYDLDQLKGWASGATETGRARPKRVVYRGVKDAKTLEVTPSGDLVLRGTYQAEWDASVISTSQRPDQALSYAVTPMGYNVQSATTDAALGAIVEIDEDVLLSMFNRTREDLVANPIVVTDDTVRGLVNEHGTGPHLIGGGEDQSEIALVLKSHAPPEDYDEVLQGFQIQMADAKRAGDAERVADIAARRDAFMMSVVPPEDTIVIPAGSWAIQDQGQMRQIVDEIRAGAQTRWPWLADTTFETESGVNIEDMLHELLSTVRGTNDPAVVHAYLSELAPDQRRAIQGIVGYRDDAHSLNRLSHALVNDERHLRSIDDFLGLRGQGEFLTQVPAWTPFYDTREDFESALIDEIYGLLMRPESQADVRLSRFALQTPDGRRVANPMQEGVQRVYQPTVGQRPKVLDLAERRQAEGLEGDELVSAIVSDLLGGPDAMRTHTDFVKRLPEHVRERAVRDAIERIFADANKNLGQWTVPLGGVAYDDPRIAQWVSDLLTGDRAGTEVARQTAYLDLPRGLGGSSQQTSNLGDAGRSWAISPEHQGRTAFISGDQIVTLADGSVQPGVAYTEAIHEYAKVISRKVMTEHSARATETYRARPGLQRRVGDQMVGVGEGELLPHREDLFDAEGAPVPWADDRYFELGSETGDDLLWPVIGPMIRDHHERTVGLQSRVRKTRKRQLDGWAEGARVPETDDMVTMTRSRTDDLHLTRELDLPNVAISEMRVPLHDNWWDKVVRHGFDRVIGPVIDATVRKPMTFHAYAAAYEQNLTFLSWMLDKNLINVRIPEKFAAQIDALDSATKFAPGDMADIRTIAARLYGTDLSKVDDVDAARWFVALGDDQQLVAEMDKAAGAARRADDAVSLAAANRLSAIDVTPMRLADVSGSGPAAERLVAAYYKHIPEDAWSNADRVNAVIRESGLGLPLLAEDGFTTMSAAVKNWRWARSTVEETAKLRALENVIPFLDSHEQRSQMSVIGRNLLPFWYAEENFLKRWARVFSIDGTFGLSTLRKAQLGYMGIRSAGMIRTDSNGKDWFVYPGSGILSESLSKLPFIPDTLPLGVMFQTSTDAMLPGVNERFGTPSVSPWVALGMDSVTMMFPDATPVKRAILGDIGASQSALSQFVPTTIRRAWEVALSDEDSSRRYAAAMMAAAAMMEAEGNGIPDSATPDQVDEYLDKLRNHARVVLWSQMISGFFVPGSPQAINTGTDVGSWGWLTGAGVTSPDEVISSKYRDYVSNLGMDEGTSRFLADFPYADLEDVTNPLAYTVSATSSVSGAPLPATRTGMAWYDANSEWIDSMPEAGAWFLPPDADGEVFDYYSYSQQLVSNLRKRRTPTDFVRALKYRQGAAPYFEARDQYEATAARLGNDQERKRMLDEVWDQWRKNWLDGHPIFAEELMSDAARQRRNRTIDQLRYAVTDPAAPEAPSSDGIREMSQTFDMYRTALRRLTDRRDADSVAKGRKLKAAFEDWAAGWVLRNPHLEQMWTAVYRPEASL